MRCTLVVYTFSGHPEPHAASDAAADDAPVDASLSRQFHGLHQEFERRAARVFGLSVDPSARQRAWAKDLGLSVELLSDDEFRLQKAMRLPASVHKHQLVLQPLVLVIRRGRVLRCLHPVAKMQGIAGYVLESLGASSPRP